MISNFISVGANAKVNFLAKIKHESIKSVSIRIIEDNSSILFVKNEFSLERFEFVSVDIKKGVSIAVEVNDESNCLSLEYFVIYDERVYDNGVTYLDVKPDELKFICSDNMNSYYSENKYRNQFHFSPLKGWINDPNGMIYYRGYYHMFFQYYPHAAHWGNMHWGHAVSRDLVHWKHFPIALMPGDKLDDEHLGGAFSGNAVEYNDRMYLFYTDHYECKNDNSIFIEEQCFATSSDGIHFDLNPVNPVISVKPEKASKDFRDPKVFKDSDGLWKMILGGGYDTLPSVLIYSSDDLVSWAFEGPLYQERNIPGRAIECPDFYRIGDKYVLMLSVFQEEGESKNYFTRYIVGEYENNRFSAEHMGIMDFGPDFYATQTFSDDKGRRLGIAWIENWTGDIIRTKSYGFSGAMSIPREFYLDSDNKLRSRPVDEVCKLRATADPFYCVKDFIASGAEKIFLTGDNCLEILLDVELLEDSNFSIKLRQSDLNNEFIEVQYCAADNEISIINSEKNQSTGYSAYLEPLPDRKISMRIFIDCSCIEVFANDYKISGTVRFYIEPGNKNIIISGSQEFLIKKLNIWYLNSCW